MTEVKHNEPARNFQIFVDGKTAGTMTYTADSDDVLVIDHTEVDEAYSGQGLGKELVKGAADFARKSGKKIKPVCSFARNIMQEDESYHDVLDS